MGGGQTLGARQGKGKGGKSVVGATVEVVDVVKDASAEVAERETEKGPQSSAELSLE